MNCRTIHNLLSPFQDGELPPARAAAVAAHLDGCPGCRSEWQARRRIDAELRALPAAAPDPRFAAAVMARLGEPRRRAWSPLPAAAYTLLFLAIFGAGFFLSRSDPAPSAVQAQAEISLGSALAENRSLELLAVHDQTVAAIEELDRAQE